MLAVMLAVGGGGHALDGLKNLCEIVKRNKIIIRKPSVLLTLLSNLFSIATPIFWTYTSFEHLKFSF